MVGPKNIFLLNEISAVQTVIEPVGTFEAFAVAPTTGPRCSEPPADGRTRPAGSTTRGMRQTLDGSFERLYRSQILQENMRLKGLAEINTMHSFSVLASFLLTMRVFTCKI